jgi:hypothetical protein
VICRHYFGTLLLLLLLLLSLPLARLLYKRSTKAKKGMLGMA